MAILQIVSLINRRDKHVIYYYQSFLQK